MKLSAYRQRRRATRSISGEGFLAHSSPTVEVRTSFLSEAPRGHLLHVATHGEFPDENALDHHGILQARTVKEDGAVRASAVRKFDLSSTLLVMLSVCNGGLYRIGPADEPYGLMPAFLQAGSQNVVGTLWEVEDSYGRLLATEFYKNLKFGPAEALRQASLVLIGQDQTVRRWASFVSVGPGRWDSIVQCENCGTMYPSAVSSCIAQLGHDTPDSSIRSVSCRNCLAQSRNLGYPWRTIKNRSQYAIR